MADELTAEKIRRAADLGGMDAFAVIREAALAHAANLERWESRCECGACNQTPHASDCAVHNEPAYPAGECDCVLDTARIRGAVTPRVRSLVMPEPPTFGLGWVRAEAEERGKE